MRNKKNRWGKVSCTPCSHTQTPARRLHLSAEIACKNEDRIDGSTLNSAHQLGTALQKKVHNLYVGLSKSFRHRA
jgi:hypothetical protein